MAAIDEVHVIARRLGLPPQALTLGDRNGQVADTAAEVLDVVHRVDEHLAALEESALGPQPVPLSAVNAPADPDAFLVSGFIRPGTTVMLTGAPGSSKSWAARQLAVACGAGLHSYLDRYQVARAMQVLVIDEDNGPDEEWRREEAILASTGLDRSQVSNVQRLSLAGVRLDQVPWQRWLMGHLIRQETDLLVLDPISEMHGGKELREDPAFRGLLAFLKRLKVEFPRLATLLVHHTRKGSAADRSAVPKTVDDVRGQWGQTPDVVALIWRLPEHRLGWELHKRVPHSALVLEATDAGPLIKVADESTVRERAMSRDDRVLGYIDAGLTSIDDIVEHSKMSRATVWRAIKSLRATGIIGKDEPLERVVDRTDDPIVKNTPGGSP